MIKSPSVTSIQKETTQLDDTDHLRKMFIGGLSPITNEDSMRIFFKQWGEVIDAVVMRDPITKRSRGFGFVTYSDATMVDQAQAARPHVLDGKSVDSKRALPRLETGKPELSSTVKKIFVGGLKESHDEQALNDHFTQFGRVINIKILADKNTGRKRGFAFVEFDDYDSVDKAVLHKNHTIKYVLVDVKKSVYRQELAKKLAAQNQNGAAMPTNNGMPSGNGVPGGAYAQQPAAAPVYNQQAAYGYAQPVAAAGYNNWNGYATGYPAAQPQAMAGGYGAYGAPQQNGTWNTAYVAPNAWPQNGYAAPAAQVAPTSAPVAQAVQHPAANGWNGAQNFGEYQQAYNGGPQKAGSLQGNRMNPYSVATTANYGV